MKIIFLIFLAFVSLEAIESRDELYKNIDLSDEDNETKNTIKQYVNSSYNVSAHNANYFLPISYRFQDNYVDLDNQNRNDPEMQLETEFQVSIKFDMGKDILGLNEIYTVAYTQKSFWQLYTKESAYFRESNYNPEFFITMPFRLNAHSVGLKALRIGGAHQSNGQGGKFERSWNYFYVDTYLDLKYVFADFKLWYSPNGSREKYNPDLLDYLGYGYLKFLLPYKKHMFDIAFRYGKKSNLTTEINYSYPMLGRDDLFIYLKGFHGYGESLIDYNVEVTRVGIGFSISR